MEVRKCVHMRKCMHSIVLVSFFIKHMCFCPRCQVQGLAIGIEYSTSECLNTAA